ncbi:MAG TPA: SAM-dependent chlorinase/fluorinase [Stenomitos sp.]
MSNAIVTLLSDFGSADVYVGTMKGIMLQINPALTLVDLTHRIPAQNIQVAAFQLQNAIPYFPHGTVHLVVVDPGVGSQRRAIALKTQRAYFVGPDNGVFSSLLNPPDSNAVSSDRGTQAVVLDNPTYWSTPTPSLTFHGRDIFAPVAAHLASGVSFADLGTEVDLEDLTHLPRPQAQTLSNGFLGEIQAIDGFGNAITNIPGTWVEGRAWIAIVGNWYFPGQSTYSCVAKGEKLGLVGSHGWLELAFNGGSAQQNLGLAVGNDVQVTWQN